MSKLILSRTEVPCRNKSWDGYNRLCVPFIQETDLQLNNCCIKVSEISTHLSHQGEYCWEGKSVLMFQMLS